MTRRGIAVLVAVVGWVGGCGGGDPGEAERRAAGKACSAHNQCETGHCDSGYCCSSGTCCRTAEECPGSFRSAAACTNGSSTTNCQGTRRDATCEGYSCGTRVVEDDSGCAGAVRDCGGYRSIACSGTPTQTTPVCTSTCAGPADCDTGFTCSTNGECIPQVGTGGTCTGTGQGTCAAGLKCQNGVCCAAGTAACCTVADQQTHCGTPCMRCGLSSRCEPTPAGQTDTHCATGTCRPGTCNGAGACAVGGTCSSGQCGVNVCQSNATCGCRCEMQNGGTTYTACPGGTISFPCSGAPGSMTFPCSLSNGTCQIGPPSSYCGSN